MEKIILDLGEFEKEFDQSDNYKCSTYFKKINIDGTSIDFSLIFENCENENQHAFVATTTSDKFHWVRENLGLIKEHIANKMIELANDWREQGEEEISKSEFMNRIKLYGFNSFFDQDFELFFEDGNIFAGHDISINIGDGYVLDDEPSI